LEWKQVLLRSHFVQSWMRLRIYERNARLLLDVCGYFTILAWKFFTALQLGNATYTGRPLRRWMEEPPSLCSNKQAHK
jgi:hypothetical protein